MEGFKTFLESSTIHGLTYIATGKKYVRLFWIIVVIAGFSGAGVLIYQSFQSWNESPVTTTIETHPISKITFPKVIVCPPKNTYTDLNYDLKMTENLTLHDDIRNELSTYSAELLYEYLHHSVTKSEKWLNEYKQFSNWYNGYSTVTFSQVTDELFVKVETSAVSGNVSLHHILATNFMPIMCLQM